jgi:hypothetical protein
MAIPTIEKRHEYVGYAEHCVRLARQTSDAESRDILQEMAAEYATPINASQHRSNEFMMSMTTGTLRSLQRAQSRRLA